MNKQLMLICILSIVINIIGSVAMVYASYAMFGLWPVLAFIVVDAVITLSIWTQLNRAEAACLHGGS